MNNVTNLKNSIIDKTHNPLRKLLSDVPIKDIMNKEFTTVYVLDTIKFALKKILQNNISHLLVINGLNVLVGILTPKYIYKELAYLNNNNIKDTTIIKNVMFTDYIFLMENNKLVEALQKMAEKKITCIPILDVNNNITGTLNYLEMLDFFKNYVEDNIVMSNDGKFFYRS